jgi:hypothetical protein
MMRPDAPNLGTGPDTASLSDPVPEEAASGSLAQVKVPRSEYGPYPCDCWSEAVLRDDGFVTADGWS